MESTPPAPEADPRSGDPPPPGEATVGDEVELQGRDRLDRIGDPGGTAERDEQLQQPVAGQRAKRPKNAARRPTWLPSSGGGR